MDNLEIYNTVRKPPSEALKPIDAGRLKGKSDINPMWRIKALTEVFGICGIGWKYEITKQWLETGGDGVISAFCNINLYIKVDGEWSAAIPGTGGSAFVASERNGLYTSDECFKMALTDAISVSCKALGFAADVYWSSDRTKYSGVPEQQNYQHQPAQQRQQPVQQEQQSQQPPVCAVCGVPFQPFMGKNGKQYTASQAEHFAKQANVDGVARCWNCRRSLGTEVQK